MQDASASEEPDGDAAMQLVETLSGILAAEERVLFLCCINRGVLARCRVLASRDPRHGLVAEFATRLGEATAIGGAAAASACWPLSSAPAGLEGRVACWPMDTESLLLAPDDDLRDSPVGRAFAVAAGERHWEVEGRCADCTSRELCPFRQNAKWARDETVHTGLLRLLRRGELATGRRWNFRDTFSLVAEIMVGERGDFLADPHPCEWVHTRVGDVSGQEELPVPALGAAYDLVGRLFPSALFTAPVMAAPPPLKVPAARAAPLTAALQAKDRNARGPATTHVRRVLEAELSPRLDPALRSPHDPGNALGRVEDDYSASVNEGNAAWPAEFPPSGAEAALLAFIARAEEEWDPQARDAAVAARAIAYLRATGAILAKRSIARDPGSTRVARGSTSTRRSCGTRRRC